MDLLPFLYNRQTDRASRDEIQSALELEQMRRQGLLDNKNNDITSYDERGMPYLTQTLPEIKDNNYGLLHNLYNAPNMDASSAAQIMSMHQNQLDQDAINKAQSLLAPTAETPYQKSMLNLLGTKQFGPQALVGVQNYNDPYKIAETAARQKQANTPIGEEKNLKLVNVNDPLDQFDVTFNNKTRELRYTKNGQPVPAELFRQYKLQQMPRVQVDNPDKLAGLTPKVLAQLNDQISNDDMAITSIQKVIKGLTENPYAVGFVGNAGELIAGLVGQFGETGRIMSQQIQSTDAQQVRTGVRLLTARLISRVTGDKSGRYSDKDMERVDEVNNALKNLTSLPQALATLQKTMEIIQSGREYDMQRLARGRARNKHYGLTTPDYSNSNKKEIKSKDRYPQLIDQNNEPGSEYDSIFMRKR